MIFSTCAKSLAKRLPVSKSDVRPSQCVYCSRHDLDLTFWHLNCSYIAKTPRKTNSDPDPVMPGTLGPFFDEKLSKNV
jgi:hypothetical protein